ncbi:MAG: gliding motility protein GldN [Bacteroidales bacterium]|jgi:gliding motility associated protien GldN|nr:gliding motility protein GldN [Bacteroidales bacterium]
MKKLALITISLLFVGFVFAQEEGGSTLEQPKRPLEFPWTQMDVDTFSVPVAPVFVRQNDVMYYHTVWRTIDLREKRNHPYYFPTYTRGTWRSLAQTIFDAIDLKNPENPNALPVYSDEFCTTKKTPEEVRNILTNLKTITRFDPETGEVIGTEDLYEEFQANEVLYFRIKEIWFFDKQRSVLEVRILTIEPIVEYEKPLNTDPNAPQNDEDNILQGQKTRRNTGIIMWDELRPYLVQQEMFNVKNNAARLSFDDAMTWKRQFTSFIYQEQNTYSDRPIQDYIKNPRDQRIESDNIINKIRMYEHELWEF